MFEQLPVYHMILTSNVHRDPRWEQVSAWKDQIESFEPEHYWVYRLEVRYEGDLHYTFRKVWSQLFETIIFDPKDVERLIWDQMIDEVNSRLDRFDPLDNTVHAIVVDELDTPLPEVTE